MDENTGGTRMAIALDPDLERLLEQRARAQGYHDLSGYLRNLLQRDGCAPPSPSTPGERLVAHLRGKATKGLTTDEIMAMTRKED